MDQVVRYTVEDDCWTAEWGDSRVRTRRPPRGRLAVWRCAAADHDDRAPSHDLLCILFDLSTPQRPW